MDACHLRPRARSEPKDSDSAGENKVFVCKTRGWDMALKVSLKPDEQFVVNGAVVRNGDRRTNLILQNKVSLLREKDIIQEEEANTPSRRIYFAIMLMYLD